MLRVVGDYDTGGPPKVPTPSPFPLSVVSHLCKDTAFNKIFFFLLKYCYTQWNAAAILVQGGITKQPCLHFKYLR